MGILEYEERLKKERIDPSVIKMALEVIREEERNITYQRPPHIIGDIMKIIDHQARQDLEKNNAS